MSEIKFWKPEPKEPFWKPMPKEPWKDWRTFSMLLPIFISATGFFVSGIFAFAFSDIGIVPELWQSIAVIVSSGLIVWGAELNTPGTVIEVFRKILRQEANGWDISALVVSLVGTTVNLLVTFASRTRLSPVWQTFTLTWGPLIAGLTVACDYYGGLVETGFLFGSFEVRMESWLSEKRQFDIDTGQDVTKASRLGELVTQLVAQVSQLEQNVHELSLPVVRKAEWDEWTAGANGDMPQTLEEARAFLLKRDRRVPSERTARRWGLTP